MKKIILAMMACAGLCACSSDDIDLGSTQKVFEGDVAYMKVNLNINGASTRATNYISGTTKEDAVSNAYFYFYDEAGSFVTQGEITGETWSTGSSPVDEKSSSVVILTGLTGKGYPKYVVTVLNKPSDFEPANSLNEMEKKLAGGIYDGEDGTSGNFIMSTSSYTAEGRTYNFVTELPNDNSNSAFYTETELANATPVDIYVERLAAKVLLSVDGDKLSVSETSTDNDNNTHSYYKLVETIAGEPNTDEANNNQVATDLYVEFLGWKLNATAGDSYMMKNIDSSWSDSNTGLLWYQGNESYSSSWCKSYYYDSTVESDTIAGLNYVNLANVLTLGEDTTYCAENTNSTITSKGSAAVTNILVKAQAYEKDENGSYKEISLVRYNGLLFTLDAFFATIGLDNGYYADAGGTTPLSSTQLEISSGSISVKSGQTIYAKSEGSDTYTSVTADFSKITDFDYFNGGLMYYTIPIKHLNTSTDVNNDGSIPEGVYGVVRNYFYKVSITGLSNLGKPVSSEDDKIYPNPSDNYIYYYVPAEINILSWKEVTQGENL